MFIKFNVLEATQGTTFLCCKWETFSHENVMQHFLETSPVIAQSKTYQRNH